MSIIVKKGGDFEELRPGVYRAVCKGVFDIGQQKREWQGDIKYVDQVIIVFEVDERMTIEKYAGERFNIAGWYTKSLSEKATLRNILENWRGRAFTPEELEGFDIEKLVGINCTLSIIKSKSGKSVIGSISMAMKNQAAIKIEKPYLEPPDWIKKLINNSYVEQENAPNDPYKNSNDIKDEDIPF